MSDISKGKVLKGIEHFMGAAAKVCKVCGHAKGDHNDYCTYHCHCKGIFFSK